ncbi:MAG TPA: ATP-binding protein [Rhizomicrobium sp.]|nr:ATP-binding protein [Rhizomicrobium sp.]
MAKLKIAPIRIERPRPFRVVKRAMPRGLFGRSLIIIVAPVVLLLGVVTYVFFERHYDIMTARMARGVAADVAFLINIEESNPPGKTRDALLDMANRNLGYQVTFTQGAKLEAPYHHSAADLKDAMHAVFANQFGIAYPFTSRDLGNFTDLKVQTRDGVLRVLIPRKRLVASNVDIFILWMVGSSLVLLAIAILFLRNQVRPIENLARAAEAFGKGRSVPDFKPYGATEVRRAAQAFITMRERIERYLQQRTDMLAGVSHDLKTPLTRLKLELAMMDGGTDTAALKGDIAEMEHMLDEYLDFARGEGGEESQTADLADIVRDAAAAAARARGAGADRLMVETEPGIVLSVRRNALRRCATNLIDNALKHGKHVEVALHRNGHAVEIVVDDDGPGIPEGRREEAFRPFHRLDEGRNLQKGGSGLGLAIARDIARAHGGDLTLETSKAGGLRAAIRLPV